ncbi:hypothetical protein QFZ82_000148 [Streptomyces sp. V4I23]|nr:hypothetical protein [Streptomyces sp. V4I23]
MVTNKAAHLVIGVDVDGIKNVLGIWLQDAEGSKFWLNVLTQLRNRGLKDALIVSCDGLDRTARGDQYRLGEGSGPDVCDPLDPLDEIRVLR